VQWSVQERAPTHGLPLQHSQAYRHVRDLCTPFSSTNVRVCACDCSHSSLRDERQSDYAQCASAVLAWCDALSCAWPCSCFHELDSRVLFEVSTASAADCWVLTSSCYNQDQSGLFVCKVDAFKARECGHDDIWPCFAADSPNAKLHPPFNLALHQPHAPHKRA
jgi:hypothetical protein